MPAAKLMCIAFLLITLEFPLPNLRAATIILVRHAERPAETANSVPLTRQGHKRAQLLARMLAGSGVKAIFTSDAMRTQQTAAPLAAQLHIEPSVLPANATDVLVAQLQKLGPDEVVLVVGHSNTIPAIVGNLGGLTPPIADSEFDRVVIVHTQIGGKSSVLNLHYGN